ncbi:ABC transporter ATP-binding protein [Brevundimonas sp. PAMC22021]|uniref:ABC transporter ATP-binding protein n=1 Tax=Brevundimonas sp. PAMC22021 TaxID=2861285 RepID=UPI001C63B18F|nr:ABC transporter ATP-binding protein [Brevundimonas sp. PAMC22021]QYF87375.1 ABC transporter ATP-binding protein [Brevundimonas sp. PAMC22021]
MSDIRAPAVVLEARGLTKRFGPTSALHELDLKVHAGEVVCLLGANGAGKTTTINLFLGFLEPSAGQALVLGRAVGDDRAAARAALGYVAEIVSLYPSLTGAENLTFFHRLSGAPELTTTARDALLDALDFPRAALDRSAGAYSKGMRQKLGLAIAVARNARAILLDEPLSGLDPKAANDLVRVLQRVAKEGVGLLISTHDIFRAKEVADWIGIMAHGRMVDRRATSDLSAAELEQLYLTHMAERAA